MGSMRAARCESRLKIAATSSSVILGAELPGAELAGEEVAGKELVCWADTPQAKMIAARNNRI
jgi:hypothetical protein